MGAVVHQFFTNNDESADARRRDLSIPPLLKVRFHARDVGSTGTESEPETEPISPSNSGHWDATQDSDLVTRPRH